MAKPGSVKALSVAHETYIALLFDGVRSKSSGAALHDAGDVRTLRSLIECKMTGHPGKEPKSLPVFVQHLEKVAAEAWEEGRDPMVAMRYYKPDSLLARSNGWVDITVRLAADEADREYISESGCINDQNSKI